ncbi:MAG: glycosyltransferase family 4 protein [Phycisphaerae bacterium]|nr:glycosyltransferase family 4 protein [Phycisphaerae bacterium]
MRILVVSQFFAPDITAAAFRVTDVVTLLGKAGHDVKVITSLPHKAQVHSNEEVERAIPTVDVHRVRLNELKGGGLRRYLSHYLSFVRRSAMRGVKIWLTGWRPDVIWASSPPLFVGLSARFLSMLFRKPLVFEIRDIWPDTAVAAGQLSEHGRGYRIGRKLELYMYRKARHLTCVSMPMKAYIQGLTDIPVSVVYNGVPEDHARFDVAGHRPAAQARKERILLYAGNIGHLQELDLLIRGFVALQQTGQVPGWRLRIVGAGQQVGSLESLVKELDASDSVSIDPPLSRENAFRALADADALYLNLKKHPVLARTIPSKVFDYLLAARPIVAGLAGEGREILESTGANLCFEPGDVEALKASIVQATRHLEELEQRAPRNRKLVIEKYTREKGLATLLEVFRLVVAEENGQAASARDNGVPPSKGD